MLRKFADISLIGAAIIGVFILILDMFTRHIWYVIIDALWLCAVCCVFYGCRQLRKLTK